MSSAISATPISTVSAVWLPGRKPKATPRLRVLTSSMPGRNFCSSPGAIEPSTARLVSWSASTTPASVAPARTQAVAVRGRAAGSNGPAGSAVDEDLVDDPGEDAKREDRED